MFFQSAFEVEAPAWLWTRQSWQRPGLERQEATHNYSMPWQSQGIKVVLFSNKIHECMRNGARTGAACLHLLLLELGREFLLLWVKHPDICTPRGSHKTVQISPLSLYKYDAHFEFRQMKKLRIKRSHFRLKI